MLQIVLKRWKIVLAAVFCTAALAVLVTAILPRQYKTQITYYALNFDGELQSVTSSSISAAQSLAKDYARIVKSDVMISKISEALDDNMPYDRIQAMITAETLPTSSIFEITVRGGDSNAVQTITKTLTENFENLLSETVGKQNAVKRLSLPNGSEQVTAETKGYMYAAVAGALAGLFGSLICILSVKKQKN